MPHLQTVNEVLCLTFRYCKLCLQYSQCMSFNLQKILVNIRTLERHHNSENTLVSRCFNVDSW